MVDHSKVPQARRLTTRITEFLVRNAGKCVVAGLMLTAVWLIPFIVYPPKEEASYDPKSAVIDLRDELDNRFDPVAHVSFFVLESRDGDVLTRDTLMELQRNTRKLRQTDADHQLGPESLPLQEFLYRGFDPVTQEPFVGVSTFADYVEMGLNQLGTTLSLSDEDEVKLVISEILARPEMVDARNALSVQAFSETRVVMGREVDYWVSPALFFSAVARNDLLGGGASRSGIGSSEQILDKERFNRAVQEVLRGEQETYRLWGIAIDQNLQGDDESKVAGVFIMLTVIAAVLVVGMSLRSYWAMSLVGVSLGALMIWLKGISNLVGLDGGPIIEILVPIAMIALGVDFAVHALKRYQEVRDSGWEPTNAIALAFTGILGALILAMLSDGIAFLSNSSSGIEAVVHFGVAGGIAAAASFLLLGVVTPLAMMIIDRYRLDTGDKQLGLARVRSFMGGIGVSVSSGISVIFLVAVDAMLGVAMLSLTIIVFLMIPGVILKVRCHGTPREAGSNTVKTRLIEPKHFGRLGVWSAILVRYRYPLLFGIFIMTFISLLLARNLAPTFDVRDIFVGDSDFVTSLDKLDMHGDERAGEPALVYLNGDLTDIETLMSLQAFVRELSSNPHLSKDADGRVLTSALDIFRLLDDATRSEYFAARVAEASGITLRDSDRDGIPDSSEQVEAILLYARNHGVPINENVKKFTSRQIQEILDYDEETDTWITTLQIGIVDSTELANVRLARESINHNIESLREIPKLRGVGLTGSSFIREAQLDATTRSLQTSLPIAIGATLILLLVTRKSLRYAVVTVVPIALVVVWLYALMYVLGFKLNFVTVTIGALSVGVGVDYSIHMTERFREEINNTRDKVEAIRRAADGTGGALLASAASSIAGFTIMGFAPMPVISSFGVLTAIMIGLALIASLVVLPSLLFIVTPDPSGKTGSRQ
jgi:predicted RND superfamily exporter protein